MYKKKKRAKKKTRGRAKAAELRHVVVTAKNYGNKLKGIKIYYEGSKSGGLRPDGTINLGKNVLEILSKKFGKKFRWIVCEEESSIEIKYNIARVRTSRHLLQEMSSEQIDRNRDIKHDIINRTFSTVYPSHFTAPVTSTYAARAKRR